MDRGKLSPCVLQTQSSSRHPASRLALLVFRVIRYARLLREVCVDSRRDLPVAVLLAAAAEEEDTTRERP